MDVWLQTDSLVTLLFPPYYICKTWKSLFREGTDIAHVYWVALNVSKLIFCNIYIKNYAF